MLDPALDEIREHVAEPATDVVDAQGGGGGKERLQQSFVTEAHRRSVIPEHALRRLPVLEEILAVALELSLDDL